jgi:hypothetical protein
MSVRKILTAEENTISYGRNAIYITPFSNKTYDGWKIKSFLDGSLQSHTLACIGLILTGINLRGIAL